MASRYSKNESSNGYRPSSKKQRGDDGDARYSSSSPVRLNDGDARYSSSSPGPSEGGVRHKVAPSPVIHIRGLEDHVSEDEIRRALQTFGSISYCMSIPHKKMALVEFEDVESARGVVKYAEENRLYINGKTAMFNYSTSRSINRPSGGGSDYSSAAEPNNVILLTIMNVQHPITVDVIYAVCNPISPVVRIVIFRKNGVQSMVEFETIECAAKAKANLNGADIYANCCTIKAEFAKPKSLHVPRNTVDTWDFTAPTIEDAKSLPGPPLRSQPLLASPGAAAGPLSGYGVGFGGGSGMVSAGFGSAWLPSVPSWGTSYDKQGMGSPMGSGLYGQSWGGGGRDRGGRSDDGSMYGGGVMSGGGGGCAGEPNCVLMLYGLVANKINCTKIFNIFCQYGNVMRIKFLKSKEGWAMVQMANREACDRVIDNFNGKYMYGSKFNVSFSKQPFIQDVTSPYPLEDSTPSFLDCANSRNNRFSSPMSKGRHPIVGAGPPSTSVYFFNAPPNVDDSALSKVFRDAGSPDYLKINIFPPKTERSSRGVLEFADVDTAIIAIACANNAKMTSPSGPAPYVIKLAFTLGNLREDGDRKDF